MTDTKNCYVTAKIGAIDDALGFILWIVDGRADHLEGYTLALDNTEGMDLVSIPFELVRLLPLQTRALGELPLLGSRGERRLFAISRHSCAPFERPEWETAAQRARKL